MWDMSYRTSGSLGFGAAAVPGLAESTCSVFTCSMLDLFSGLVLLNTFSGILRDSTDILETKYFHCNKSGEEIG